MEKNNKSTCGCLGRIFQKKPPKPLQEIPQPAPKVCPQLSVKSQSASPFFSNSLPGVPRYKTTIITGQNNNSFSNSERLLSPPIQSFSVETQIKKSPSIFEKLRISPNRLPILNPTTPGRSFRIRSQAAKS